jgi:hypothetical protein
VKVRELIERLQQLDPEAIVVVDGYEEGVNDVIQVRTGVAYKNATRPFWVGRYALDAPGRLTAPGTPASPIVYLPRLDDYEADEDTDTLQPSWGR